MKIVEYLLTQFTYVALILILGAAGIGVPIPEDIPLIFSGYLCNHTYSPIITINQALENADETSPPNHRPHHPRHVPNVYVMIAAGMLGVLGGDSVLFFVGKRGVDADNFVARHIRKVLHSNRREKVEAHFKKHGNLTVFVGRFMPGLRGVVFAMAGLSGMSYLRFILINGFAAAISVPTFILIGFHFAKYVDKIITTIERAKSISIPIALCLVAIALAVYLKKRKKPQAAVASENKSA